MSCREAADQVQDRCDGRGLLFFRPRRSIPVLRSRSHLRSRPALLSKLTPIPSGDNLTIQPVTITFRRDFSRVADIFIRPPSTNFSLEWTHKRKNSHYISMIR
ncbi:hypothetical protein D1AOALGA4SA_9853 [Olavius algarvensis Delta 1 endosymbiont]|nr:hypothetical protein D1AOALGA4SA_9853 [Olavius algarvensis Delta 1 endosymbiont]